MELKYKKILYCTDFSDDADYAFLTALDMAEKYQAHLYRLPCAPLSLQVQSGR